MEQEPNLTDEEKAAHAFARIGGQLKAEHKHVRWHRTAMGPAFYRRPSAREFLGWQEHKDATLKSQAFDLLIEECFLGVIVGDALVRERGTFAELVDIEGFAYVSTGRGSAGTLLLRLCGALEDREGGPL